MVFGDSSAIADSAIATLPHGLWSSVWFATTHDHMAAFPNTLTMIVLASNFGTFMLYMLSCVICMVAYQGHPNFSFVKHMLIPVFGVLANLVLHGFLPHRAVHGVRHEDGAIRRLGHRGGLGHLRSHLLHQVEQGAGRTTFVVSRAGLPNRLWRTRSRRRRSERSIGADAAGATAQKAFAPMLFAELLCLRSTEDRGRRAAVLYPSRIPRLKTRCWRSISRNSRIKEGSAVKRGLPGSRDSG